MVTSADLLLSITCLSLCQGGSKQRYDGWYNNKANPRWGSAESDVVHSVPPAYSDFTYMPAGRGRPNARYLSNTALSGPAGLPSYRNRTILFLHTGQLIAQDIVRASEPSCPVELLRVPVPENDTDFQLKGTTMPFMRSAYDVHTGQSPNQPRRQINYVTTWLDANFLYGSENVWSNCLRAFTGGQLLSHNSTPGYPALNKIGLPLVSNTNPVDNQPIDQKKLWMFGSGTAHMTPGMTALAIVWFRFHNHLAAQVQTEHGDWGDEMIFQAARRRVIATWQNIVYHEWLPEILGQELPPYDGYQSHVEPGVTALFEAAAFRFGHSMIPPAIYIRNDKCQFRRPGNRTALRMCNVYWNSQKVITRYGLNDVILGMASQIAEREDHILVNDIRGKIFGPMHFSRHDVAVLNIMRGRDHGLADYATVRRELGLGEIQRWEDINPWLAEHHPEVLQQLKDAYGGHLDQLDVFPAGLYEATPQGMGPLFRDVIREQFVRLRDADRFWFENMGNGIFTEEEVAAIRNTTMYDVIMAVTDIDASGLQPHVFRWLDGDPCPQPGQLSEDDDLENCTPYQVHDYFAGSEIPYIIGFTALCLFPFLCVCAAYLIYKWQRLRHWLKDGDPDETFNRQGSICRRRSSCKPSVLHAHEWIGKKEGHQAVRLEFDSDGHILKVIRGSRRVRTINFQHMAEVPVWLNMDGSRNSLLINLPKEYDMVLQFYNEEGRLEFVTRLNATLPSDKGVTPFECREKYLYQRAVTKERRQEMLTQFFRSVFAEAYKMDELAPPEGMHIEQCKDVADCELSREEFAEALALTPDSLFVTQMFQVTDRENKGYISFRDMIYTVTLFTKGSAEQKLRTLFVMYDLDRSGYLDREEVGKMIKSMVDMAPSDIAPEALTRLQDTMFADSGLEHTHQLTFEDFKTLMAEHLDKIGAVSLQWKGASCESRRRSSSAGGESRRRRSSLFRRRMTADVLTFMAHREVYSRLGRKLHYARHYVENNKQHMVYVFCFLTVCCLLFLERFYMYAVEREHRGFRSLTGYGLSVTRGAAAVMSFCFSLLLLTMCRNLTTALRDTLLNLYIPFDSHVAFHKLVAYTALAFTLLHIVGYCFNFYHLCTQPLQFLCVFEELFFSSNYPPTFTWWLYGNLTGSTGFMLVVVVFVIYIFATQTSRKHIFNTFWITHQLYYVLYILVLLHGCQSLVQEPFFPYYFIGPAIVFTIDKMIAISRKRRKIDIVRATLLPSNVTHIQFKRPQNFEYKSGQWVRLACLPLGENEYHPLTLTSAPHEDTLSVHIRAVGPWSTNIRSVLDPNDLKDKPFPKLYLDGPYGAGQQDWSRYDVSIMVGGGIGVTPYASILKHFVFINSVNNTFNIKCKKVYFIWVTGRLQQWEWMIDLLSQVEEVDKAGVVEINIFLTQLFQDFDLRTTMLYICEEQFQRMANRSMFTGLKANTHFGRPNFEDILVNISNRHPKVGKIGVFSCGPPGMTRGMEKACYSSSGKATARFEHHYENF